MTFIIIGCLYDTVHVRHHTDIMKHYRLTIETLY
jgi:hypothetical protein